MNTQQVSKSFLLTLMVVGVGLSTYVFAQPGDSDSSGTLENTAIIRDVECRDQFGNVVDDSLCDPNTQPNNTMMTHCPTTPAGPTNTYSWVNGNWGPCVENLSCQALNSSSISDVETCNALTVATCASQPVCMAQSNGLGTQTMNYVCHDQNGTLVDSSLCNPNIYPGQDGYEEPLTQTCNTYYRSVTDWGPCNNNTQTRTVTCLDSSNNPVDDSYCNIPKPIETQTTSCIINPVSCTETVGTVCTNNGQCGIGGSCSNINMNIIWMPRSVNPNDRGLNHPQYNNICRIAAPNGTLPYTSGPATACILPDADTLAQIFPNGYVGLCRDLHENYSDTGINCGWKGEVTSYNTCECTDGSCSQVAGNSCTNNSQCGTGGSCLTAGSSTWIPDHKGGIYNATLENRNSSHPQWNDICAAGNALYGTAPGSMMNMGNANACLEELGSQQPLYVNYCRNMYINPHGAARCGTTINTTANICSCNNNTSTGSNIGTTPGYAYTYTCQANGNRSAPGVNCHTMGNEVDGERGHTPGDQVCNATPPQDCLCTANNSFETTCFNGAGNPNGF